MARINDPPPPPESLESLRRRFTRQNKDIIRSNYNQAQRIHGLEAEVTRLLAENLSLKQALITEQEEVTRLRNTQVAGQKLVNIHAELEKKFAEASVLVGQLISRPRGVQQKSSTKQRPVISTPTRESWQHRRSLLTNLQDQDGRLPAISESKRFPRLSLEVSEMLDRQTLAEQDNSAQTDSPEIGPPPVAQFEELEPEQPTQHFDIEVQDHMDQVPTVNVERRRKRRTSSLISEMEVSDVATNTQNTVQQSMNQELPRASAKRKLDASELENEDQRVSSSAASKESFVYHRRPSLRPALGARKSSRFTRALERTSQTSASATVGSPHEGNRKALAPKSTNSPTKKISEMKASDKTKSDDDAASIRRLDTRFERRRHKDQSSESATERPPTRGKSAAKEESAPVSQKPSRSRVTVLSDKDPESQSDPEAAPKTPFLPDDMLSPPSTKPSGPANGRTIQEAVIMNSVEDVLNGSIGRGSRRAKAAVSYAEPNLRDKMRRPGQLVGAVEGYDKKAKESSQGVDQSLSRATSEDCDLSAQPTRWSATVPTRAEPGSPLREKQSANEKRKRETIDLQAWASGENQATEASLQVPRERKPEPTPVEKSLEGLSIFDHPVSSPSGHEAVDHHDSIIEVQVPVASTSSRRRTLGRAPASTVASSGAVPAFPLAANRRHSLQPTSSATSIPKTISSRVSLNGPAPRLASSETTSRSSAVQGKRISSKIAQEPPKSSAVSNSHPSAALLHHRRSTNDVLKRPERVSSNESNISDVEDESDEEPINLSMAGGDNLDNSSIRATRRRSMLV